MTMILDAFMQNFMENLITLLSEKVNMVREVKDELEKLQSMMEGIHKVLQTAERWGLEEEQPIVKIWLGGLKDVAYDADDIIDRCRIEGALLPSDRSSPTKETMECFYFSRLPSCFTSIPHRYQIAESIKSLNHRLEEINKYKKLFKLEKSGGKQESQAITTVKNHNNTSHLLRLDVVGDEIEEATRELVKMMVEDQSKKCRIFAITGMGGIGKTTLANKIYNNKKMEAEFQIKSWVSISQSYNEIEVLQQVIRVAGGSYGKAKTKAELKSLLKLLVHRKRVFLVLDDIWKEDVWISLLENLLSGASILRILITTRNESVARKMKVVKTHTVKQLSNKASWDLLWRSVLVEGKEKEIEDMTGLGIQIAAKCYGLPLAVKVIADVLNDKGADRKEWENVLKNEACSMIDLLTELRDNLNLSYDDLPSHLKQCFIYCSLFSKNEMMYHKDLLRLWVAEGFVEKQSLKLVEDIADEYYNDLIKRNLLQPVPNSDPATCKMHYFLRSLATFLSKGENFYGKTMPATTFTFARTKLRRLSIKNSKGTSVVEGLIVTQKCVRTLLCFHGIKVFNDNQLSALKRLRVLHINDAEFKTIPNSIGDLIHLRYLDFDHTSIKELPESIGSLANLQFLNLCNCRFLTTLPESITKLHNLRSLGLYNTPLNSFPKGISKLENINELRGFVVADPIESADSCSSLQELLNSLYQIRKLHISKMERAQKGGLSFQKLTHLVSLKLMYTEEDKPLRAKEDIKCIEDVLEELCPPPSLEDLFISNFFGRSYPSWMKSNKFGECLPHLTRLEFVNNISCPQLPSAGELPQLSCLNIKGAYSVKSIGPEFLGKSTGAYFPNLQRLALRDMPELKNWTFSKENEEFKLLPRLDLLFIVDCPKLKALPKELEKLKIKELRIMNNQSLKRVSHLPALQVLIINNCPALKCVEELDSLQRMELVNEVMDEIPEWLAKLLKKRKPTDDDNFFFQLHCDEIVLQRMLQGGPDWPIIEQIPRVLAYQIGGSGYLHYTKNPSSYSTSYGDKLIICLESLDTSDPTGLLPRLLLYLAAFIIVAIGKFYFGSFSS